MTIAEPEKWLSHEKHGQQVLDLRTNCLWAEPPVELPEEFAQVLADVGTFMWHAGKFTEATTALETAEDILDDNRSKSSNPLRANIFSLLSKISSSEGVRQRTHGLEYRHIAAVNRDEPFNQTVPIDLPGEREMRIWDVKSDLAYGLVQEQDNASIEQEPGKTDTASINIFHRVATASLTRLHNPETASIAISQRSDAGSGVIDQRSDTASFIVIGRHAERDEFRGSSLFRHEWGE